MPEPFGWSHSDLASIPPLTNGEVHIYATALTADSVWSAEAQHVLDEKEKARAARFRFEEDRFRFQKTRALLRLLLASYLGREAAAIRFHEGPHGKPYLREGIADLQFNVSHTKGASVLAFARGIEVGIDIEHSQRRVDVEGVGRRVFTPTERASIHQLGAASGLRQFFRLWTAKEAYLKATGSGLNCDPSTIEADFESQRYKSAEKAGAILPYALREVATDNRFIVALAHQQCATPELRLCELA